MKKLALISILFCLVASTAYGFTAFPTPTVNGTTGLVRVPSADILPYRNYALAFDYGTNSMAGKESLYYKLNLGTFQNIEMGVVGGYDQTSSSSTVREGVFVNMKLSLSTDDSTYPLLLAMGVENLASFSQSDVYMVATKYMRQGFKLTFGFLADFPNNTFRPMGVLGAEIPLLGNHVVLVADGIAGETVSQVDAGVRIYLLPYLSIQGNALNIFQDVSNPQGKDPKSILVGISWANPF